MEQKSNLELITSVYEAQNRVLKKINSLLSAYIFILTAENYGNEKISEAIEELNTRLEFFGTHSKQYFISMLFLDLISEIELYFSSVIKSVISKYPKKLASTSLKLGDVLDAGSIDDLILKAAEEYLHKITYKKPQEYFSDICDVLSIDSNSIENFWPSFVEAKARRDLGTHNNWICNETYLRKLQEVNFQTDAKLGDNLCPDYNPYLDDTSHSISQLIETMTEKIVDKYK